MRKNIDIDDLTLTKLKILSAFENTSVKALMEKAVKFYVKENEKDRWAKMTDEEKEDMGLWLLMQESDKNDTVTEDELFKILNSED